MFHTIITKQNLSTILKLKKNKIIIRLKNVDDDDDGNDGHHPQAIYTSRLLNPFVKDHPKYDNSVDHSSLEIIDFVHFVRNTRVFFSLHLFIVQH
jgi:hypothetical protein